MPNRSADATRARARKIRKLARCYDATTAKLVAFDARTRSQRRESDHARTHVPDAVREKAIEIANALLEDDMEEGKAIRIAIAKAKEWAWRHGGPW